MERDFKGVWIPENTLAHIELNWNEKILYLEILDGYNIFNVCLKTNKYLSEKLALSEYIIEKSLKNLSDYGIIYFHKEKKINGNYRQIFILNYI